MTAPTVTRDQAIRNLRRVLDAARERRDRDRAAGRLDPEVELILRRLERAQREQTAPGPSPPEQRRRAARMRPGRPSHPPKEI